ncbi:MAG: hypothetical protein GXO07_02640, partial [Crenarchaeota archaeon]|nr:hypothetical protein [Thermoproteota archaeon]
HTVGGYALACDGKLVAIAIREPPSVGEKALEAVDDNPMPGDLYEVPKEMVKTALARLTAGERAAKVGKDLGKVLAELRDKVLAKRFKDTMESEKVESIVEKLGVKELQIFDLIDTVTLADEMAYYLEKKGYTVSAEAPEELNNYYIAVIKVEGDVDPKKLLKDALDVARRCESKNVVKIIYNGNVYYIDPELFWSLRTLSDRLAINLEYAYIKAAGEEAELHLVLSSDMPSVSMGKFIELLKKTIQKRRLPWRRVGVVITTPSSVYRSP